MAARGPGSRAGNSRFAQFKLVLLGMLAQSIFYGVSGLRYMYANVVRSQENLPLERYEVAQ